MAVRERPQGLCADCRHIRLVSTHKRAIYWRCVCERAEHGKYPRLPVERCRGYEREGE